MIPAETTPPLPKGPKGFFFGYVSRMLCFHFHVFLDKYSLDYPWFKIGGGVQHLVWLQDNHDPSGQPVSKSYWDCYGVAFEVAAWFIELKIVLTPICIKRKS